MTAVLQRRDEHWRAWLEGAVTVYGADHWLCSMPWPMARMPRIPRLRLHQRHGRDGFPPQRRPPARRRAQEQSHRLPQPSDRRDRPPRHQELAGQFALLMDGAIVTAMREQTGEPARRARKIAEMLLA
ncbi:hypothetical protein NKH18_31785 [Streptomyces sp. M10(2022)]